MMIRGKKLDNNKNISIKKEIKEWKKPDYIYIPLFCYKTYLKTDLRVGDYVYKGDVVGYSSDIYTVPIHSSISGIVKEIKEFLYIDGTMKKTVIIENDFREKERKKIGVTNRLNKYTKEEVIKYIKEAGIVGCSGNGFPTYLKYSSDLKINSLIINMCESEPFLTSDFVNLHDKISEILETIDALMEIFRIEDCIIAVKDFNKMSIEDLDNYLGSYPSISIKVVPDIYPIGYEKYLVKYLKGINYINYPIEKGIIVENVSTIYSIYRALKYKKPVTSRVVTISGDKIKNPCNILVKEGSLVSDIIEQIGGYKKKGSNNINLIINGPMMGKSLTSDKVMITKSVSGILALQDKKEIKDECNNCGKCNNICPVRLSLCEINRYKDNPKIIERLNVNKCINCGLCSYLCPAKINMSEIINDINKNKEEELI